jgi:alpha-galactosidase
MYFPVGDTIGIPGLSRGLRSAAIFAGYARLIAEHCPDAWAINYSNPLTIFTRALTFTEPGLKAFGCCHEVFGTQWMFARLAEEWYGAEIEGREEIEVNVLGINHFTWLDRATWNGQDLLARLRQWIEEEGIIRDYDEDEVRAFDNYFHSPDQVKFRMFMHYRLLPCAGDRHLVEFIPGFVQSEETLFKYGVIRTPISYRMEQKALKSNNTERILSGDDPFIIHQSDEEAVRQIKALLGLGDFMTNVNVENVGQIPNLPHHAVVETNAYFSQDSVRPLAAGSLPPGVWGLIAPHVNNQEMIVQAAITGNRDLALQAFINDPLNTASVDETVAMFEEALDINRPFLDWVD